MAEEKIHINVLTLDMCSALLRIHDGIQLGPCPAMFRK